VLLGALLTVPVGLLVGIPSVRTRGISLAVATLGLSVAIQSLVFGNKEFSGGDAGIPVSLDGAPLSILGWEIDPLFTPERYGLVAVVGFTGCALLIANLRRGRSGRRLIAVRSNERAAASLGIGVSGAKLWAFGIGAAVAGFGGALMALRFPAVLFDQFGVFNNISAIAIAVFGGAGSVLGAVLGAVIAPAGLAEYFFTQLSSGWAKYTSLIGGVALLLTIIAFRDGVATAAADGCAWITQRLGPARRLLSIGPGSGSAATLLNRARAEAVSLVRPAALTVEAISVSFGGVKALQNVSLRIEPGQVVGLIGPNGAGKTTLIDAITGFATATGTVRIGGTPLPARRPHLRARAGISRSFQSLELFEDLSVFDNLRTASDPRDQRSYLLDLIRPKRGLLTSETIAAIDQFELRPLLDHLPPQLTFGQRRLVSMARSIAAAPSVLLLDEPCAGLDETERAETATVIRQMATERGMAVLLVEHDVELVRRVCDELVVLDFGEVIAQGTPDEVLSDSRVIDAYLGSAAPTETPLTQETSA
jgi:sulfate-transporting ATPase